MPNCKTSYTYFAKNYNNKQPANLVCINKNNVIVLSYISGKALAKW